MSTHKNGNVEIDISPGTMLVTYFKATTNNLWVLEEKGSKDGCFISVTCNTTHGAEVRITGKTFVSFLLSAGEWAEYTNGKWYKRAKTVTQPLVAQAPVAAVSVAQGSASTVKHTYANGCESEFTPGGVFGSVAVAGPHQVELYDSNTLLGFWIKNVSPVGSGHVITVVDTAGRALNLQPGEKAEKTAVGWIPVITLNLSGNITTINFTSALTHPFAAGLVTIEYSPKCNLKFAGNQQSPDELEITDLGSPAGSTIENTSKQQTTVRINSANGYLLQIVYPGETAKFDGNDWNLTYPSVATAIAGTTASSASLGQAVWTPLNFNAVSFNGGMGVGIQRRPISDQRVKKCTCGTQSGSDGGLCSSWCDLVRTDI